VLAVGLVWMNEHQLYGSCGTCVNEHQLYGSCGTCVNEHQLNCMGGRAPSQALYWTPKVKGIVFYWTPMMRIARSPPGLLFSKLVWLFNWLDWILSKNVALKELSYCWNMGKCISFEDYIAITLFDVSYLWSYM
jgi:hypothetical protein